MRWANTRLNSIFSTTRLKTVMKKLNTQHCTHATINDNEREAKLISRALAVTLMTMSIVQPQTIVNTTTIPLSSTKDKSMVNTRLVPTKDWCGFYNGFIKRIPII